MFHRFIQRKCYRDMRRHALKTYLPHPQAHLPNVNIKGLIQNHKFQGQSFEKRGASLLCQLTKTTRSAVDENLVRHNQKSICRQDESHHNTTRAKTLRNAMQCKMVRSLASFINYCTVCSSVPFAEKEMMNHTCAIRIHYLHTAHGNVCGYTYCKRCTQFVRTSTSMCLEDAQKKINVFYISIFVYTLHLEIGTQRVLNFF